MQFGDPILLSLFFTVLIACAIGVVQEECHVKMDIVILLDGSGSVGKTAFEEQKDAVINLVNNLTLDTNAQRVAVIVYSYQVTDIITFSTDIQRLTSVISDITYPNGRTNTHLGINEMKWMFDTNGRKRTSKIGIVITDGVSSYPYATTIASLESKNSGITLIAVGVGNGVNVWELEAIASSESHVLRAQNFDSLESKLLSILRVICKVDGGWSEWKIVQTGSCSATCGGGTKTVIQTRSCSNPEPEYGGKECQGKETKTSDEICGSLNCPVGGGWSEWVTTGTGPCSATCGGFQTVTQTRTCTITTPVPEYGTEKCNGLGERSTDVACGIRTCPADGGWSDWETTETGPCSATCGGGSQTVSQTRTCTKPEPAYGGKECEGQESRTLNESCSIWSCPVDGDWSEWETTETEPCSATCGGGYQNVTWARTCTDPEPEYGGKECEGLETRQSQQACGSQICQGLQSRSCCWNYSLGIESQQTHEVLSAEIAWKLGIYNGLCK